MAQYRVRVQQEQGRVREHRVSADDPTAIAAVLGVAPGHILAVRPLADEGLDEAPAPAFWRQRSSLDARLFAQQLAVLLRAGIPLLESLHTLRENAPDAVELEALIGGLRDGHTLSSALARVGSFDALFIAVVSASERDGHLADTLADHAAYLGWVAALRARLVAAATYPVMLLVVGSAVVLFLILYVMPRFAAVFDGLGQGVPAGSRWLMGLSAAASHSPLVTTAVLVGIPTAAWVFARSGAARRAMDTVLWRLPQLGPRLRELALARLYRSLAHLLAAGVPALQALQLAAGLLPASLRPALAAAQTDVKAGHRLSQAFERHALSTPVAARMLRVGESSGQSAAMLQQAAQFHDEELARLTELMVRVINPLLMLIMGVVIGGIVVLMYLPIFSLMEQVQ